MLRFALCSFVILLSLLVAGPAASGAVVLIDNRVDAQQITEVRFDVPEGCVITGLGFRAHADNITTMLCRYHRLSKDGKLVDPKEARVGAEPDHACEATVLLPEGYVAVGFGGRGAPEWDITTLRVWARKLNPDGSLGKVEVFQDGKAPDSHCEREVVLSEGNRALTGAGLRYQFQDITGVYGASARIAAVSAAALQRKLPLKAWIADPKLSSSEAFKKAAKKHGIGSVYAGEKQVPKHMAIVDVAGAGRGRGSLPDVRVAELAGRMAQAAIEGKKGVAALVSSDCITPGSVNELNLDALRVLSQRPFASPDEVWTKVTAAKFGAAAGSARSALHWAASAQDLIFGVFGLSFQAKDGRVLSFGEARAVLEALSAASDKKARAEMLLAPSDRDMEAVQIEKETAFWAVRIATGDAQAAAKASPGPATAALTKAVGRLQAVAEFWEATAYAYTYASIYLLDGAPRTRAAAEQSLDGLAKLAGAQSLFTGADAFARSTRSALSEAEQNGPLAKAFTNVAELIEASKADEAAEALSSIISDPRFAPHLAKRNETIAELASRLTAIYEPGDLKVLRGGDGSWALTKADGKWAFTNQENSPCVYFDTTVGPLKPGADYVLTFEYYDVGTGNINVHYDSDFEQDRQYQPGGAIQRTDSGTWKAGSFELKNAAFAGGQNMLADFRLLGGSPMSIRNIGLRAR